MRNYSPRRYPAVIATVATSLMAFLLFAAAPAALSQEAFQPRVFRVFDGDRFLVRERGRTARIRIQGVDAPELDQPHGPESKKILEQMVSAKRVQLTPNGTMDGEFQVSRVRWQDYDIALELVRVGAAWAAPDGGNVDPQLAQLQREAQEARKGLWAAAQPVPPWEWRSR